MTNLSDLLPAGAASKQLSFTASGTIAQGKPVILNANGTVTQVAGQSESLGSEVVFETGVPYYGQGIFDSSNNKVVIIYSDGGDSTYGKAIVGTVSGTSISFGTAVTFNSATTYFSSGTFDSNSNKVVIVFRDQGDSEKTNAIVGTVSGTSISFGSKATITTDTIGESTTTFDSNSNKVVTFYRNTAQSGHGYAAVGTVSGTSISFGTPVVYNAGNIGSFQGSSTFDSSNNKTINVYEDKDNGGYGTALVGTVSGTSISFGGEGVFHSASTDNPVCTFDSTNNKVIIAYRDNAAPKALASVVGTVSGTSISFGSSVDVQSISSYISDTSLAYSPEAGKVVLVWSNADNSQYGTYAVGTVSGTSITYESPVVFSSAATERIEVCYDSNEEKFVINFDDGGNSNAGTAVVLQVASTNLTAAKFLGIADAAISNAASGKITMKGGIASNGLSSLTPGATYYVQTDGTFSTSAGDPSVEAGKAMSATSINLDYST